MELRSYQKDCLHHIESLSDGDIMVKLPCGAGKTEIFMRLVSNYTAKNPDKKVLVILNKVLLLKQTKRRFVADGQDCGVVCGTLGEDDDSKQVTIATILTISKYDTKFDMIVLDEAHRAESNTYLSYLNKFRAKIYRFTATPFTASGLLYGEQMPIKALAFEMSLNELTELDILVPISFKNTIEQFDTSALKITAGDYNIGALELLVADADKVKKQVRDALSRSSGRNKIVWVCVGIKHAEVVKSILIMENEKVAIIHSELVDADRNSEVDYFESGDARHLVSITIVAEGYDYPAIDCVVMMRPTKSPVLYVQVVGRGLRRSPGKNDCLVLDYGRVVKELGHPNNPRILGIKASTVSKVPGDTVKRICPSCSEILFTMFRLCPECDYSFASEEVKEVAGALTVKAWASKEIRTVHDVKSWTVDPNYISKNKNVMIRVGYKFVNSMITHYEYLPKNGRGKYFADKFMSETKNATLMPKRITLFKDDPSDPYFKTIKREYF